MAFYGHREYVFALVLLVCDVSIILCQSPQESDVIASKSREPTSDGNKNSSSGANTRGNPWVAGNTDCSCMRELTALKRDLREEANQRLALKSAMDTYVSDLYDLRKLVTIQANKSLASLESPPLAPPPTVAFSTKLSYNRELKPLDTVVFDTVLTNEGDCYNTDNGKFTAPTAGTYIMYATILSGYNTKVETAIIVNDKEVARIYSGAHDAHGSGSNMAVVDLRTGDSVWIRLLYQGGNHVHGYYSTFSGALLLPSE